MPTMKPEPVDKINSGGVFKGPLTFPCPECGTYHASVKSAHKCLRKTEIKYDAMFSYYNKLRASIKESK